MKTSTRWQLLALAGVAALIGFAPEALAQDKPKLDTGDTAWMLVSTALVLMMTIPGVALFYAGMVRKKNVLATMMQSFAITCLVTVLWMIAGYSLAFTGDGAYIGTLSQFFLKGLALDSVSDLAKTIPEGVYMTFQMTFAIITCALITGAVADRMKFSALLWFIALWLFLVYCRWRTGSGAAASSVRRAFSTTPAAPWCTSTPVSQASSPASCWASARATGTTISRPIT